MPHKIVTLTLNPAVDVASTVDRVVPTHKLRCSGVRHDAGGGGINVARVLHRLGAETLAIFPVGGPMGQLLERLVADESVPKLALPISGETREDFAVTDKTTQAQFRFVLPGPELTAAERDGCLTAVATALKPNDYLVASGSLPPGTPSDFYADVARTAAKVGARFVLDSSGPALKAALGRGVHLIKPSQRELGDLMGHALADRDACLVAARSIVANGGAEIIAVSLGEAGALLVGNTFALEASAPKVSVTSTVGAGDSFLAALICAMARDLAPAEGLKLAVAAGSAALLGRGTELCQPADVERLAAKIEVRTL